MKLKYIHITLDAISAIVAETSLQSEEYLQAKGLKDVLCGKNHDWSHNGIFCKYDEKASGIVLYTSKINKKQGAHFDLTSFRGFDEEEKEDVITILQKTLKYAYRYLTNDQNSAPCERNVRSDLELVFPYHFIATKDVKKVFINKNTSKENRAGQKFVTIYYWGVEYTNQPSFTTLTKAVSFIKDTDFSVKEDALPQRIDSMCQTALNEKISNQLYVGIGYEQWLNTLTQTQYEFVTRDIRGAERLSGAAGTGKTICMVLRCIHLLMQKEITKEEFHIIFVTHSNSTKENILSVFRSNCPDAENYLETIDFHPKRSLYVTTLQEWSGEHLGTNKIAGDEYLDLDAESAKFKQLCYIDEIYRNMRNSATWSNLERVLSKELIDYLNKNSSETIAEMLRYEIAVVIKGRSRGGSVKEYKNIPRSSITIPLKEDGDFNFVYDIYMSYQKRLEEIGKYDSDDITLSALGQIDTPIWKRKYQKDGYDVCFIDETQLFNFNELSVFHFMNKPEKQTHMIYAIDESQVFHEVGFSEEEMKGLVNETKQATFKANFRSTEDIINLAFNILASNATIFRNFENPLDLCQTTMTREEEQKCTKPRYILYQSDEDMIRDAFKIINDIHQQFNIPQGKILLVATSLDLKNKMEKYAHNSNNSILVIDKRSDQKTVNDAIQQHKYVLSTIDNIGGLEFDVVVVVGVDQGRVPPTDERGVVNTYIRYAWHNKMYVATTRAKYGIYMLGNGVLGDSPILGSAIYNNFIEKKVTYNPENQTQKY